MNAPPANAVVVGGDTVIAIGDVHGSLSLLNALLDALDREHPQAPLVFLGDMIDRGPSSRQALKRAQSAVEARPGSVILLGNHDEWLVRAIAGDDEAMELWLPQGGRETLRSFGIDPFQPWQTIRSEMRRRFPDVSAAIAKWPRMVWGDGAASDYLFVHAGVDPTTSLHDQDDNDLIWIRKPFLDWPHVLERRVVHGHTIEGRRPVIHAHRIGVDTGAWDTGVLTALILQSGEKPSFLLTDRENGGIILRTLPHP